jgi:hypothetical protein
MSVPQQRMRLVRYTRWLAAVIVPFLVVASVLLYVLPTRTDALFAWTITPPLSAQFLASAYLGGIWFFVRVARAPRWQAVKHGFPAVVVFASLLCVATLIDFDAFHQGHISFVTWLVLYLSTPFLTFAAILANRGADPGTPAGRDYRIPAAVRIPLAMLGIGALACGSALFLAPEAFLSLWAWPLTPLTARVAGAILTLPGMVNVWLLVDARWSAFRLLFQAQLFSLAFIVGALVLSRADLDWSRPAAPLFVSGIGASLVAYLAVYLTCERRLPSRAAGPPANPGATTGAAAP